MQPSDKDKLLCPHCIEPIDRFDHFCPHCGDPVSAHASTDPLGQVLASGRAFQNATDNPRLIVVVRIWLIVGPQIPLLLFVLFLSLTNLIAPGHSYSYGDASTLTPISDGFGAEVIKVLLLIGLLVLYGIILQKVTARYIKARHESK